MKRAAKVLFGKQNKRAKHEVDISAVPENVKEDWTESSSLQHMNASPMATTVLESLTKKATDLNFMFKFCAAATEEGSGYFQTRLLGSVRKEARFHRLVAKDLPLVENIKVPVKIRNKLPQVQPLAERRLTVYVLLFLLRDIFLLGEPFGERRAATPWLQVT